MDTSGGLSDKEIEQGVLLSKKLDKMCPHFEHMHALYGARPNVFPCVLGNIGVDDEDLIHLEDTNEGLKKEVDWYMEDSMQNQGRAECVPPSTHGEILDGELEVKTPS
jgi:hypothetical protein